MEPEVEIVCLRRKRHPAGDPRSVRKTVTIAHANGQSGSITRVTSPHGRWIGFTYDTSNRITLATDNIGRTVAYTYDANGNLSTVTDPENGVTTYTYDATNRLATSRTPATWSI